MSFCRFSLISALVVACTASLFGQGVIVSPEPPVTLTRGFTFSPVTLATSETARITVVNTAAPATTGGTPPSCTGSISFLSSGSSTPLAQTSFTLGAGQFVTVNLPYLSSGITTSPGEVLGQVTLSQTFGPSAAACTLSMSLVVFDTSSGVGHLVVPNAQGLLVSAPIPPGGF